MLALCGPAEGRLRHLEVVDARDSTMLSPARSQMSTRLATRSARGDTECPEPHQHDRARDQAPAAGDGKADRKREDINPFLRHDPHPMSGSDPPHSATRRATTSNE